MAQRGKQRRAFDRAALGTEGERAVAGSSAAAFHCGAVVPSTTEIIGERASRVGVGVFSAAVFVLAFVLFIGLWSMVAGLDAVGLAAVLCAVIAAAFATLAIHIAQEWERVVVLRFGAFNRVSGPGLFFTWPVVEQNTMRVDTRVRATTFGAEETLTADLVPLNVNAVLFWHVWDAKAACLEVGNFTLAVELAAQTALREAIGRAGAAEVAIRRNQLDRELKAALEEKVAPWGVTILSVEVRDILLPKELQDIMSLEAQAEQRKKARIILTEAEKDICDMMGEMGDAYAEHADALRLRAMHLLYESVRETGGTVVVPSSFSEGFGDILGDGSKLGRS